MSYLVNFKQSLSSWLPRTLRTPVNQAPIHQIKAAMLDLLNAHRTSASDRLSNRIMAASDLDTLWYARTQLMQTLSFAIGESAASLKVQDISGMFYEARSALTAILPESLIGPSVPASLSSTHWSQL